MTPIMPLARTEEIIVQTAEGDCLVYDLTTNKALCLNDVSAEIWKRCDGINTVQEVAEIIGKQMNVKLDEDFIWLAIADLEKNNLLAEKAIRPTEYENLSRRKVLFKYALPSLILPVIVSIVAPSAVNAQSGGSTGQAPGTFFIAMGVDCNVNAPSCSGQCNSEGMTICASANGVISVGCGSFCTCQCV